ncbi:hypothetical protein PHLGIDRAFT_439052 [Phlebiopsis gigantea 11061_1 CR5-6]|uniref:G-protein coupled receptors family 1 profile domain-containing protein n=1 Tax=Phlebiopsis gigantea (strain 11061_1 CR5-6) TaxID=745531 RepID=A0A0C3P1N3_PHLG1|nr:hypothetical protein PHLGIDRAFT_439052 [Phlebiopsis gigantea 11061_1 CR5-6]
MVDWHSEQTVELTMYCFSLVTIFLLGMYTWYLLLSFHKIEFGLIVGRIRFQPAYIPYLLGRYADFAALITITVISAVPRGKPSQSLSDTSGPGLVRLVSVLGDVAVSAASCNLALRAMVLWRDNTTIFYGLICACAIDFIFALVVGVLAVSMQCDPDFDHCTIGIVFSSRGGVIGFFLFTVAFDTTILVMTILGMRRQELPSDSNWYCALFNQGVLYVTITLLTCIPMGVMAVLRLNDAMNIFFLPAGCTISVIASSASVTALFKMKPVEASKISLPERRPEDIPAPLKTANLLSTVIDLSSIRDSSDVVNGDSRPPAQTHSYLGIVELPV